jgi:hypothetical protein
MDSLKFHPGPPCLTLISPAGGPPLKRPYGHFRGGLPTEHAACGRLLPLWTPHAVRLWNFASKMFPVSDRGVAMVARVDALPAPPAARAARAAQRLVNTRLPGNARRTETCHKWDLIWQMFRGFNPRPHTPYALQAAFPELAIRSV